MKNDNEQESNKRQVSAIKNSARQRNNSGKQFTNLREDPLDELPVELAVGEGRADDKLRRIQLQTRRGPGLISRVFSILIDSNRRYIRIILRRIQLQTRRGPGLISRVF